MERQFPRNVRQIGNVSDNPKIYVEDYVDTFITQMCQRTERETIGAFFVGETTKREEQDCIFVSGAVEMEDISVVGTKVEWGEDTWKKGMAACKEYFGDKKIVGWYLSTGAGNIGITEQILHLHERRFGKGHTFFVLRNALENEEIFYAYKYRDLMPLGGHYVYYEKNPSMQNYMVRTRTRNGASPLETYEDRAAQDFRNIVRERLAVKEDRHSGRLLYTACTFLVLIILVVGITMINNFDKMSSVQSSIEALSNQMDDSKETANQDASKSDQEIQEETKAEAQTDKSAGSQTDPGANAQTETGAESETQTGTETGAEDEIDSQSGTQTDAQRTAAEQTASQQAGGGGVTLASVKEVYTVAAGDTLAGISEQVYGTVGRVDEICSMNGLEDGNRIYEGEKLWLPE